jgi:hypothetical protein
MNIWMGRFSFFTAGLLSMLLFMSYSKDESNIKRTTEFKPDSRSLNFMSQNIRSVPFRDRYIFAGEAVPIQNFDVKERLDRELLVNTYWHSNTILCLKAAQRYLPMIEKALKEFNIPQDFKYIPIIETSLRNETSPAGAKGIWQFMKPVGDSYQLEINEEVDERFHYTKATQAACRHLLRYKQRFGSWTLAAAAYNAGEGNLNKELERQGENSYYNLSINDESSRYLFRLIALKEIVEHPEDYGFFINPDEKYNIPKTKSIEVKTSIADLGDWARRNGTTYRMLKVLNPWLRSSTLTNKLNKIYYIEIPD